MFLILLILFSPLLAAVIRNRTSLIERTAYLVRQTQDAEWKAWRLSATEPVFTTAIIMVLLFMDIPFAPFAILNLLLFIVMIARLGLHYRRVRLVLTIMTLRIFILVYATVDWYLNSNLFTMIPLILLFISQLLFCVYQMRVTPELERRGWGQPQISPPIDEAIINEVTFVERSDLWDEQVALIERLKAEAGTAEPQPIGRAHKLL